MPLTADEQKKLDELLAKKDDATPKPKTLTEDELKKMNVDEVIKVTMSLIEKKQDANSEAKTEREKRQEAEQKLADIERAKKEAELSAVEKLKLRDDEVAKLNEQLKNNNVLSSSKITLIAEGFPEKIVNAVLKDVTAESAEDALKTFRKDYKEYKTEPKADPTPKNTPKNPSNNSNSKKDDDGGNIYNKAQTAVGELRENAEKK